MIPVEPIKVEPVFLETVENKIPTELEYEGRIYRLVKTKKEVVKKMQQVLKQKATPPLQKGELLDKGEVVCKVNGNNVYSKPLQDIIALKGEGMFTSDECYKVLKKYYNVKESSLSTLLYWYRKAMDIQGADHLYKVLLDMWRAGDGRTIANIVHFSGMGKKRVEVLLKQLKKQGRVKQYGEKFNPRTESKGV